MFPSLRPADNEAAECKQTQQHNKLCNVFHGFTFLICFVFELHESRRRLTTQAQRPGPPSSDYGGQAHGTRGWQPRRDGRVRCSAWLGRVVIESSSLSKS